MPGDLIKRSFTLSGHRTSVALEPEFWEALGRAARSRGERLASLVAKIDAQRGAERSLASSLRVFALEEQARQAAADFANGGNEGSPR